MSNSPRYEPSMESLKLAVELTRINGSTRAAFDIIKDAALFDAYLFGDLIVALGINDGAPNFPNFKRAEQSQNQVFTRRSHSSSPNSVSKDAHTDSTSEAGSETVAQNTETLSEQARDELLRESIMSDIRRATERELLGKIASDKMEEENVAQPAFKLSVDDLLQIIKGFSTDALKERALNELKRRCGEGESVHVKERG